MSWHCAICGSPDNKLKWCKVMVASIHGGIPIHFVAHIECIRNVTTRNGEAIKEGCDYLDEEFDSLISRGD